MRASDLVRRDIATLNPYQPVVPFEVLAEQLGRSPEHIVKLNANENPYGPSPEVREALARLPFPHIYPDPESRTLRAALADLTGVPAEVLMAGAGADELVDLIMRLFLLPGDAVLDCPPTFGMYTFDAELTGARVIAVPRHADMSLDLRGIHLAARAHLPKVLFLASPNNPDGSMLPDEHLKQLLQLPLLVVLDEAYVEFAGPDRSRIHWVTEYENLVVLRTFSKWAGLAGIRVGYGAFPACIMPDLWKIKQPYGVSQAASVAALAALQDADWSMDKVERITAERARLARLLDQISYLQPYPSAANFILCRVTGRDAAELKDCLEQQGILIRYYRTPRLSEHVRISVGTPEQTDALIRALREL